MPCGGDAAGMAGTSKPGGAPHPHCPQGDCGNAACVSHCMLFAVLPTLPSIAIPQQHQALACAMSFAPESPPQERLRPPIA